MSTYMSDEKLEEVLQSVVTQTELDSIGWSTLSSEAKSILHQRATKAVDSLPFRGKRADRNQVLKFPRIINGVNTGVPDDLLSAVALTVVNLLKAEGDSAYNALKLGVKSFSIGKLSMSFGETSTFSPVDAEVKELYLSKYLVRHGIRW